MIYVNCIVYILDILHDTDGGKCEYYERHEIKSKPNISSLC